MRCHGDAVLGRVALVDGDYLEGRGRDVEVREPGVLQVVKVALGQSVPAALLLGLLAMVEQRSLIERDTAACGARGQEALRLLVVRAGH